MKVTFTDAGREDYCSWSGDSKIVISAEELEDLEDALAVARSRLREAGGEVDWIGRGQVKRGLGLDR